VLLQVLLLDGLALRWVNTMRAGSLLAGYNLDGLVFGWLDAIWMAWLLASWR
jgi:hypothetical protein